MRAGSLAVATSVLLLATSARAEPDAKNPDVATAISATATVLGAGLAFGGHGDGTAMTIGGVTLLLGPSAGHWYSGSVFSAGLGVRLVGAAVMGVGADLYVGCDVEPGCSLRPGAIVFWGGLGVVAAGAILDIARAPRAARDWNRAHGAALALVPTTIRTASGDTATGLALTGRF